MAANLNSFDHWRCGEILPAASGKVSTLGFDHWRCGELFPISESGVAADQTISPTGIASEEAFGSPTIIPGAVTLQPSGIASAEAFGSPTVLPGNVTITTTGIPSEEAFGTPTVITGETIIVTGIPSAEAFGTPTIIPGGVTISPEGIPSGEAFGTVTVSPGGVTVSPTGIASGEAFGTPIIWLETESIMARELKRLQSDITARLNSRAYFSIIPVVAIRAYRDADGGKTVADILGQIDAALAGLTSKGGKNGAAVSVLMPVMEVEFPNLPGPQGKVVACVRVQENAIINQSSTGTQRDAEEIAVEVLRAGHHWRLEGCNETLVAAKNAMIPNMDFEGLVTWDILFEARMCLPVEEKTVAPAISIIGTTVTLTDRESGGGSSIYYSTDDSLPWIGNGTLYAGPFAAPAGTKVRYAAYKSDKLGSDVGRRTVGE